MPSHPRPRTTTALAATAAAVAFGLTACSGTTAGTPDATTTGPDNGTPGPAADAALLAALADTPAPTGLPPAAQTTDQAEALLLATLPPAAATAGLDAASVRSALEFTAHLVAVSRLDRGYLCGPRSAAPVAALAAPTLLPYLAGGTGDRSGRQVQVTIGASLEKDDCGTLRWVGPGVVLGPQTWTVEAGGDGTDVTVRWSGTAGYPLADPDGRPEPWSMYGHVGYRLVRQGAGWRLGTWTDDTDARLSSGWPAAVPVPDGYLPVPAAPAGDPAALNAVRGAAAALLAAPAVTTTTEVTVDGTGGTAQGKTVNRLDGTTVAAPARGDAVSTSGVDGATTGARDIHLDHGRRTLSSVTGTPRPAPGKTIPARLLWTSTDDTKRSDGNAGYPLDPFALAAVLGETDTAAPATCPTGLPAARCYTAVVVTSDEGDPLAGQLSGVSHRAGRPYLVLAVGLDEQGRPAHLRLVQDIRTLGTRTTGLTGTTTFTGWADTPPPPVTLPDPATIAPDDDVDF